MTVYSCAICNKEFSRALELERHMARKTACSPNERSAEKIYPCVKCDKKFGHKSAMYRHAKKCSGPKKSVEQLEAELQIARDQVRQLSETVVSGGETHINNIDNSVTNNTTNINITLNNYGHENQHHLESMSYSDLKRVLKLTPDHDSLVRMISFIHLNDDIPENQTIRLDNKNSSVINVYKRGRWREQNANTVLYDLICRNRLRFVDVEETLRKGMTKGKFDELAHYLCKAEDMANSENADLHLEFAFQDLMYQIREKIAS